MPQFNLVEHLSNISNNLMARYKLADAYQHKGGKGQIREAILIDWLRELLPDTVDICKGEIVDSNLRRSCEFDVIIYLNSPMPKLFSSQEKRVIPAETVLAVIEVKSYLKKDDIDVFANSVMDLNKFSRYFRPTEFYLNRLTGSKPFPEGAILIGDRMRGIGPVVSGLFAFEAPKPETVQDYFTTIKAPPNFGWVFVLESCFWLQYDGKWLAHPRGVQSITHLVTCIVEICKDSQRFTHVEPNFDRYIDIAAKAMLSDMP